jgi:hypothetical protein
LVVHYTDAIVVLASADASPDKITGTITPYIPSKATYEEPAEDKKLQPYKIKDRKELFQEVHVYVSIPMHISGIEKAAIRKEDIVKFNTYNPARGASIGSHVLGVVTIAAVVAGFAVTLGTMTILIPMSFAF